MSRAADTAPLDFADERDRRGESWERADPHAALIERVSTYAWRVCLPDGEVPHLVVLADVEGDYRGYCDCAGYEFQDGPCAHLCTLRKADFLAGDVLDTHGQPVQVADVEADADHLAGRADEVSAPNGGSIR